MNKNHNQDLHQNQTYQQQSISDYALPLAIRRHVPGSTDPPIQQAPDRSVSQASNAHNIIKQISSPPISYSAPIRKHPPITKPLDPNDRPIKPMKDTSVYNKPATLAKINPPKKPLPPLKPIKPLSPLKPIPPSPVHTSDRVLSPPKPVRSSPTHKPDAFLTPLPPTRMNNVSNRRPIQTNIKTIFDIETPPQPIRRRQIVVNEYHDVDDYPVAYVKSAPKKMISYRQIPVVTTREMKNYQIQPARRMVQFGPPPPVETIIYRI